MEWDHFFGRVRWRRRLGRLSGLILLAGRQSFLQQGIEGAARQTVARHLKEGAWQGFTCGRPQGWIVLTELFLFLQGTQKTTGHIAFGAGFDQGVAILRPLGEGLLKLSDAPFQTFKNLFGFLPDVGELTIGQIRHVRHENFSVVSESEKGWTC